jgi:predicted small metal-binding protein
MPKVLACGAVVPDCEFTANAQSEEELLAKVAEHARVAHGLTEVTPDLLAKVKAAIHDHTA